MGDRLNAVLALVLTFILPGAGHLFSGMTGLGLLLAVVALILQGITWMTLHGSPLGDGTGSVFMMCVALYLLLIFVCLIHLLFRVVAAGGTPLESGRHLAAGLIAGAAGLGAAFFATPGGYEIRGISNTSTLPALLPGDYVVVAGMKSGAPPPRSGDLVLFHSDGTDWLKRIVAGPGDSVRIENAALSVNGVLVTEASPLPANQTSGTTTDGDLEFRETLPNGASYMVQVAAGSGEEPFAVTVPDDSYFTLGDRRHESIDSRNVPPGFVARDEITGRPIYVVWSPVPGRLGRYVQPR